MGGGGRVYNMKLRLNSAKAEAQASSLGLAELGNIGSFSLELDIILVELHNHLRTSLISALRVQLG